METKTGTIGDWLKSLSIRDTSSEEDSRKMERLLRKLAFPKARVVLGVVYVEGRGTIDCPPTSIHSVAKTLCEGVSKQIVEHAQALVEKDAELVQQSGD